MPCWWPTATGCRWVQPTRTSQLQTEQYGLRKGYRGRFGMYLPPLLEELGLVELEHNARNNRVRAKESRPAGRVQQGR